MINTENINLYKNTIMAVCPDVSAVYLPDIRGAQNNVLIAKTPNGEKVFKFNDIDLVEKNAVVSQLYNIRGIRVPNITAHNVDGICFEEYQKIPGKTLYQAIQDGMTNEQIKHVYSDILVEFEKMSRVHPAYINKHLKKDVHDIAYINVSNSNNRILAKLCMGIVYLLNLGRQNDQCILHSDISPKNIIVSDNGKFNGLVDVDNVCLCNKNYAFGMMAAKYKELGFDISDLIDEYRKISQQSLSENNITGFATIAGAGKKLLWKHRQTKQK